MKKIFNTSIDFLLLLGAALLITSCAEKPLDTSKNITMDDIPDVVSVNNEGGKSVMDIRFGEGDVRDTLKVTVNNEGKIREVKEFPKDLAVDDTISGSGVIEVGSGKASCLGCSHFEYVGEHKYYIETESEYIKVFSDDESKIYKIK